jgi:phenylalanyl-tRNA synthetase beta chain
MKVLYDWLKEYVGDNIPDINKIDELFTFHAFEVDGIERVGNHEVLDVKILPDRSSDCLSHRGIARELATLIGKPLAYDPLRENVSLAPVNNKISITIENSAHCQRFATALVTGVTIAESPLWLKERLQALGQRSINNVVDATNYVMLALGQPLHAYDASKISQTGDVWKLGVRMARDGEVITTLSGDTFNLTPPTQLIVDASTDVPLSIAGIKGGKHAEIDMQTTSLILEAAHFDAQITRKSAQALRLQTDASKRFENALSPELAGYGLREVVSLITTIAGGVCEGFADSYPSVPPSIPVYVAYTHINTLLGVTIPKETVDDILSRLGFICTRTDDGLHVTTPFERTDINIAEDVIAEVGRIYGYEHIASVLPVTVPLAEYNARHVYSEKVRTVLVKNGFSEVITSSFRKKDSITLQNALASDKGCLRSTLSDTMKETLNRNMPNAELLGLDRIEVFELGTVFSKTTDGTDVTEHVSLALGVRTKQHGYTPKDDARLSEVITQLETALGTPLNMKAKDGVAECNFSQILTTLPTPTSYEPAKESSDVHFTAYSAYPFVSRDIALWVPDGTNISDCESLLQENAGELLVRRTLFDEFMKDGRTSYAFRLIFQSFERTLTDEEINGVMEKIYSIVKARGFEVR